MKVTGILLIMFLFLFSCGSKSKKRETKKAEPEVQQATTDRVFSFDPAYIPKGFVLDTMYHIDSSKQAAFIIYYFKALGDSLNNYNKSFKSTWLAQVERELDYYSEPLDEYATSEVEYGPMTVVAGNRFICSLFMTDSYTFGGNHHNFGWYALNYDRKTNRMLWYKNEFRFKDIKDSTEFRNLVGRNLDEGPKHVSGIGNDSIAFYLDGDMVEFGPSLDWANGWHTAQLPLDSVARFLNHKGVLWELYSGKNK